LSEPIESFSEAILETVHEPLVVLTDDARVISANRAFYRTFQVEPTEAEGRRLYELWNREWDIPRLHRLLGEIPSEHKAMDNFDVKQDFPGIGRKVMRFKARRLREADTGGILLTIEDVTEQWRLDAERRSIETGFTTAEDNLADHAGFAIDVEGRITTWSGAAERLVGYTGQEAIGKSFSMIFTAADRGQAAPDAELRTAREQGRAENERWHVRKDGQRFWALGILSPVYDDQGNLTGFVKILRDRSAWKRADEAMRQSDAHYRALIEASSDVVYRMNADWSELSYPLGLGTLADEPPRGNQWFDRLILPEDRDRVAKAIHEAIDDKKAFELEHRVRRADGSVWWAFSRAIPILDDAGAIVEWMGMACDVTAQRQAEQALQQTTAELRALTTELTRAEHRERKRLAHLLHDHTQQLIVAARMHAGMLRQDLPPGRRGAAVARLEGILTEALDSSRNLVVELSPPALEEGGLIGALDWLASHLQERYGFAVHARTDQAAEPASDDTRLLLFECVRELVLNAAKHADAREVDIMLARHSDAEITVVVRDNGHGFDPDRIRHQRADEIGFGLFSIRQRLLHMGGRMNIESAPAHGTQVSLFIPSAKAMGPVRPSDTPADERATTINFQRRPDICRLLIVDDHPIVREGLARLFEFESDIIVIDQIGDAKSALAAADALAPDVILMDVNLGDDIGGIEATRRILARHPGIKIVGLSMHTTDSVADAMRNAGAVAYLNKGGRHQELIETVRRASH
jgi:PAS domain S-box-containing protein